MNYSLIAFGLLQANPANSSMWIIIIVVLLLLFFFLVVIGVGLTIFFVMRKRSKAQKVPAASAAAVLNEAGSAGGYAQPVAAAVPAVEPPPLTPPADLPKSEQETKWLAAPDVPAPAAVESEVTDFDPSRTVAIERQPTIEISYGKIKFVSGVLAGKEFAVQADGEYIGREPTLSQIVVSDPRISKRHLWLGVRDGAVMLVDQESRNGTFINDPKSERVVEARLNSGDTVIMGESDVARFEYHS